MFIFLLLPFFASASVLQDDVSAIYRTSFSLKEVCEKMTGSEAPLIDIVSGREIDCMGKKVDVGIFCEQMMAADPYYLRGHTSPETKEVTCVSGKTVIFKYMCVKLSDQQLCSGSAATSCAVIKAKLARRLDPIHASYTKNTKGIKQLNCYFGSLPSSESVNRGGL